MFLLLNCAIPLAKYGLQPLISSFKDYECQIRTLQEQVERQSIMTESIMSSAALTSSQFGDYCSSNEDYLGQ